MMKPDAKKLVGEGLPKRRLVGRDKSIFFFILLLIAALAPAWGRVGYIYSVILSLF